MKKLQRFDRETDFNSTTYPTVGYMNNATGNRARYHSKPTKCYSKTDYFTTTALEDCVFTFYIPSAITTSHVSWVSYSTDNGTTWVKTNNSSSAVTITTPTITVGNKVLWKGSAVRLGIGTNISSDASRQSCYITADDAFDVSGNIMSLLYGDNYQDKKSIPSNTYCFACLFCLSNGQSNLYLRDASCLNLPAMELYDCCYYMMFRNCTNLVATPELPATDLGNRAPTWCYSCMFAGCLSLTKAPTLPATRLTYSCYRNMFEGCTNLTTAPELPATTLSASCYYMMFYNCTNLVTAPELPATSLQDSCYVAMFQDCTSLTTAPVLPATTLVNNCYGNMFNGCSSLNYVKAMFTTTPGNSYTNSWLIDVSSAGTFVKNSAATWNVTGGMYGVPFGWTIQTASS